MNNISKKIMFSVICAVLAVGGISYLGSEYAIDKTSINISEAARAKKTIEIEINAGEQTKLSISGVEFASFKNKNQAIVDVDEIGNVTAIRKGIAIVDAFDESENKYTFKLKVKGSYIFASSISIAGSDSIKVNEKDQLTAIITPDEATDKTVIWESSDPDIVTIDSEGNITGVNVGTATINCKLKDRDLVAQKTVNVVEDTIEPESISINGSDTVTVNKSIILSAIFTPDNTTNKNVKWETSDSEVATITSGGVLKGIKEGTVTITCTSSADTNIKASKDIIVKNVSIAVNGLTINGTDNVKVGTETLYTAAINPSNATNKSVRWSVDNSSIATVDQSGKLKALRPGKITLTCVSLSNTNVKNVKTINISANVISVSTISISGQVNVNVGNSIQLLASVYPSNATYKGVTWSVNDKSIATISSNGTLKGLKPGKVIVTCKSLMNPEVSKSVSVTVNDILPSKISITNTISSLNIGKTATLKANVSPANATNKSVKWTSSDPSVISVSSTGTITAKKKGQATVTCTSTANKNVKASVKISVVTKDVEKVCFKNQKIFGETCYITLNSSTKNVKSYTVKLKKGQGNYITLANVNTNSNLVKGDFDIGSYYFAKKGSYLSPNSEYTLKVIANSTDGVSKSSGTYTFKTKKTSMYRLNASSSNKKYIYNNSKKVCCSFSSVSYFTGMQVDKTWVKINFATYSKDGGEIYTNTGYIKKSDCTRMPRVTSIPTYQIGQVTAFSNGQGVNACGAVALTVAVNGEKNKSYSVSDFRTGYGNELPTTLSSAASRKGYVLNYSSIKESRAETGAFINSKLAEGHSVIVLLRYSGGGNGNYNTSGSGHFVTIMGHENGYYYISDSAWSPNGNAYSNSLVKVQSSALLSSIHAATPFWSGGSLQWLK